MNAIKNPILTIFFIIISFNSLALSLKRNKSLKDIMLLTADISGNVKLHLVTEKIPKVLKDDIKKMLNRESVLYLNYMFQGTKLDEQPIEFLPMYLKSLYNSFITDSVSALAPVISGKKRKFNSISYIISANNSPVGVIGIDHGDSVPDIFIYLNSKSAGKGYGGIASKILIKGFRENFRETTLQWDCSTSNIGSNRLAKKNGFTLYEIKETNGGPWNFYQKTVR